MKRESIWTLVYLISCALLGGVLLLIWKLSGHFPWQGVVGRVVISLFGLVWLWFCARGLWRIIEWPRSWQRWVALFFVSLALLHAAGMIDVAVTTRVLSRSPLLSILGSAFTAAWSFILLFSVARFLMCMRSRPFAVARAFLDEAAHMKVGVTIIILLMAILPSLPFIMRGDGTLTGRVQNFLAYSLGITGLMLSLLTVFLSCSTVTSEVHERQIYLLAAKPIRRWQYIIGKWIGIGVLNAVMLAVIGVGIFAGTLYLASGEPINSFDGRRLHREVLTCRERINLPPPDVSSVVDQKFQELKRNDKLPPNLTEAQVRKRLKEDTLISVQSLRPNLYKEWDLTGLAPLTQANQTYHFRYKVKGQHLESGKIVRGAFIFGDRSKVQPFPILIEDQEGQKHTYEVPVETIASDGTLKVRFENFIRGFNDPGFKQVVTFEGGQSAAILYKVGSFSGNFIRSLLIIWVQLLFLAVLGLFAASFLGFAISVLLSMSLLVLALAGPYVAEALNYWNPGGVAGAVATGLPTLMVHGMLAAMPNLSQYSPTDQIVDGLIVSWDLIATSLFESVLTRGLILGLFAALIFTRRELAKVVV